MRDRAADPAEPVDGAVAAGQRPRPARWVSPPPSVDGSIGQQDPVRVEAAGGGGDQADADDPVAEQLGVLLGQRDDRHAAHRVTDQDDRPLGHDLVEDAA